MEDEMSTIERMTQARWDALSSLEKDAQRDKSDLTAQLLGLEGWRVEAVTDYGEKRRFIVSRSTGWRPVHIELKNRASSSGEPAEKHYADIRRIERVR